MSEISKIKEQVADHEERIKKLESLVRRLLGTPTMPQPVPATAKKPALERKDGL